MKNKFAFVLTFTLLLTSLNGFCQNAGDIAQVLERLPANWELKEENPISYQVTTTHYDYQLLGDFLQKSQITGTFTRGIKGDKARWNDVRIAYSNESDLPFPEGEPQSFMENFTYAETDNMLLPGYFADFPENSHMQKNLVWDMLAFETFAWMYTDSLELNQPYKPEDLSMEMDLAGEGSFQNKDVMITYTGVTLMNKKPCAVIKFSVMNNPLRIKNDFLKMKGRSHYWGEVYVSLETKQLEYGEMFEDVVSDITLSSVPDPMKLNTVRTIFVNRLP